MDISIYGKKSAQTPGSTGGEGEERLGSADIYHIEIPTGRLELATAIVLEVGATKVLWHV